jgi:mRNA interferase RelE/StbE
VPGYSIQIAPAALRQLKKLSPADRAKAAQAIDRLASQPRPAGSRLLAGAPQNQEIWRVRAGRFRIVYQIEQERLLVLVLRVGDRKEVYRRLQQRKPGPTE